MRSFTLDTNCLIAIDEARPEAAAVRGLADAHAAGKADVAAVAISASEKQSGGGSIENFVEFRRRMEALGLAHLDGLAPMAYHDVTFMDWSLWSDNSMQELERKIHEALFPNVEFIWQDYCRANNLAETCGWRNISQAAIGV